MANKTKWSHLPNAMHIDRILASVKEHPEVWDAARHAAVVATRDAIMALIAWDDCAQYLDLSSAKLEIWFKLSEKPKCLLLLPAVKAFEKIDEMELTA